jgi:hypothetical protein
MPKISQKEQEEIDRKHENIIENNVIACLARGPYDLSVYLNKHICFYCKQNTPSAWRKSTFLYSGNKKIYVCNTCKMREINNINEIKKFINHIVQKKQKLKEDIYE